MTKKYVSEFVKWSREMKLRAKAAMKGRLLWDSSNKNTYVKKKHGELK